ncbi:Hypothetical predicted protein [Mytilus galloprovincialis]|uniref:Uncharacterized protein n=1 Tax=Mytilus galloprovincialis TaxID=29158 RepID=A0A8B6HLK1_MYTGA|nr:Hypothetical predicted protein [Mytilus galloprovincialis]
MMNNIPNVRSSISSVTDTNDTNDYFTPYIHAVEGSNTCNSIDNKSESSPTLNDDLATKKSGFSNLNSYPPIVHPTDIGSQGYAFTDNTLDTGSSLLEAQLRESSYLNPYQPMVLDRDLHEYTSVNGCSNGPDSLLSDTCTTEIAVKDPHPNQNLKSNIDICEYKSVNDISNDTVSIKLDSVGDDQLDSSTYRTKII